MVLKKRVRKEKVEGNYEKVGRDFREILHNYGVYSTKLEKTLFITTPLVVSTVIFIYFYLFEDSNLKLLNYILELNSDALSVIAILAGFNTTSLAIIAASNNEVLRFLRSKKLKNNSGTILKQLISFFSFAILIQLIVLIIGILLSVVSSTFKEVSETFPLIRGLFVRVPLSILGSIWLSSILFTIMISVRNATLLYRYVLFVADFDLEDSKSDES
ncbi:hypothetical protein [Jeotgalibacillus aurantiacus]|uniref:hypothetical protein n=1 Tax=Jeotgalibacillus aurantiacus TaxID=2763266 RepID=UPI001D09B66C|nr:hypothetical protein [Jeotgalibacillus aurantiacus]